MIKIPVFARFLAVGLAVVALVVLIALWKNKGAHVRLDGSILKVRTIATDENNSIAVLDIRLSNPADVPFVVKELEFTVEDAKGNPVAGTTIAQMDLDHVLEYNKLIGPRYTPVLLARSKISGGLPVDRTVAASFPISEAALEARRNFRLKIIDVDGPVVELVERR